MTLLSTSVAVQLNVGLLLEVLVRLAGEFRVMAGPVVSISRVLAAEPLPVLLAASVQLTFQVCTPFAMPEAVRVVAVLLETDAFVWLIAPFMYNEQLRVENSTSTPVKLKVLEVLEVLVWLAGELSVTVGAVVSIVNVLVAEVAELFALSQQVTAHVWAPSANAVVVLLA